MTCQPVYPSPLLDNFSRVQLEKKPGLEGSDYVNASFVDVRLDIT